MARRISLATGKTSQLSGNIVFPPRERKTPSADQIGGFAPQTYAAHALRLPSGKKSLRCFPTAPHATEPYLSWTELWNPFLTKSWRLGPAGLVLKATLSRHSGRAAARFHLLRRTYRKRYSQGATRVVFELRKMEALPPGRFFSVLAQQTFRPRIVETMALDRIEAGRSARGRALAPIPARELADRKRIFESAALTGWRRMRAWSRWAARERRKEYPRCRALRDSDLEIRLALSWLRTHSKPGSRRGNPNRLGEKGLVVPRCPCRAR